MEALVGLLVEAVLVLLDFVLAGGDVDAALDLSGVGGITSLVWAAITLVPTVTLRARRLHDTG